MKRALLIMALLALSSLAHSDDGIYPNGPGYPNGINNAGLPVVNTPCNQTGLDFTVNCNIILIPALIH